jgi:O-methyltransferase involved in polyketide biosynthesis
MSKAGPIRDISDTARWVAMYRAIESERPDARFRDPFAGRLAGERSASSGAASRAWRSSNEPDATPPPRASAAARATQPTGG